MAARRGVSAARGSHDWIVRSPNYDAASYKRRPLAQRVLGYYLGLVASPCLQSAAVSACRRLAGVARLFFGDILLLIARYIRHRPMSIRVLTMISSACSVDERRSSRREREREFYLPSKDNNF